MSYRAKPRWTFRQLEFLRENWDKLSDEEIAEALGRTRKSVRRKRFRLDLIKGNGRGIVIAKEEQIKQRQSQPTENQDTFNSPPIG